jgi:hypothetical protein
VKISDHAGYRVRKRIGINKKSVRRLTDKTFSDGLSHSESTGQLEKYYTFLFFKNKTATNIRIYAGYVWIFGRDTLMTVFPIPRHHQKTARQLLKKRGTNATKTTD